MPSDFNRDCEVSIADVAYIAMEWLAGKEE
jgi:hypothetical protein